MPRWLSVIDNLKHLSFLSQVIENMFTNYDHTTSHHTTTVLNTPPHHTRPDHKDHSRPSLHTNSVSLAPQWSTSGTTTAMTCSSCRRCTSYPSRPCLPLWVSASPSPCSSSWTRTSDQPWSITPAISESVIPLHLHVAAHCLSLKDMMICLHTVYVFAWCSSERRLCKRRNFHYVIF